MGGRTWTRKWRRRAASCNCRRSSLGLLRYFTVSCASSAMLPASCPALLLLLDRPTGCTGTSRAEDPGGITGMPREGFRFPSLQAPTLQLHLLAHAAGLLLAAAASGHIQRLCMHREGAQVPTCFTASARESVLPISAAHQSLFWYRDLQACVIAWGPRLCSSRAQVQGHLLAELCQDLLDAAHGGCPGRGLHDAVGRLEHLLQPPERPVEFPVHRLTAAVQGTLHQRLALNGGKL